MSVSVAQHHPDAERRIARGHNLEVLVRKPGALPSSLSLAQARASGSFTAAHERFWARVRRKQGDAAAEVDERDGRRRERRITEARFPRSKRLDDFDLSAAPSIPPATLAA